ncbi:hypothetical protein DEU56DRAFT_950207 [Suillus clintonianus]|uniref:uncharacterized protein n=1 Tax=Suillus clintonianus TaxID=1904413 RepID=UPI001B871543|nr:uncharacterized protein DEU56DRAFT_950207 [Suillus clintonianus]KAG2134077.1 hypothetical protein DEU56DRAFT_950207 [Suillus clintonianus]
MLPPYTEVQYSTKPNEKMHGPLKDAYQNRTNFKNFTEQILRYNHHSLVAEYVRSKLDYLDTQNFSAPESDDHTDGIVDSTEPTDAQHFSLGSKQATMSFADIEARSLGDPAFDRFRIKLNGFLNHAFTANQIPFPDGRRIQLTASDMITEYQFLKVNFESFVDWRVSTDYLRCAPTFHGSPRYDCVILQTDTRIIFGKLMLIFTCTVGEVQYPITLILPYDRPVGLPQIQHLNHHLTPLRRGLSCHRRSRGTVAHADRQRDEAEARRRVVLESYDELNKYLATIESSATDARAGFQRILRDAGGHLVLTPIPNQIQHDHSPYSANPSITVEPPPRPYHRSHHRYTSSSPPTAPICQHILHALLDSDDSSEISASMASTPAPSKLTRSIPCTPKCPLSSASSSELPSAIKTSNAQNSPHHLYAHQMGSYTPPEFHFDEIITGSENKPVYNAVARSHICAAMDGYSSAALPPALPPPPFTRGVRPRSGSFDDPSYLIAPLQSPSKRPRNDRGEYDHRPPLSVIG